MKKVVGLVIGLLPVSVFGECVPVPDCASIGYTETSCDGDSLKCPFDSSKLKCFPCDSSFRFTCDGENVASSVGNACNSKYTACNCIAGATFVNGECICDTSCDVIGNIYYSDGTCSSCNLTDKTPVGIIIYNDINKHLLMSLEPLSMTAFSTQTDTEGNTIIAQNTDLAELNNYGNKDLALTDYNGFNNTKFIVGAYGKNATGVAAVYCYNYAPEGYEHTKGLWYLPATGELYNAVYMNKENINRGFNVLGMNSSNIAFHWSSSEESHFRTWGIDFYTGIVVYGSKDKSGIINCILSY